MVADIIIISCISFSPGGGKCLQLLMCHFNVNKTEKTF